MSFYHRAFVTIMETELLYPSEQDFRQPETAARELLREFEVENDPELLARAIQWCNERDRDNPRIAAFLKLVK